MKITLVNLFCLIFGLVQGQTAQNIINQIKSNVTCKWNASTVDVIKAGDSSTIVTGIAVCMTPSIDVLKQAVEKKCNLIVCHEPLFYNHFDDTTGLTGNPVFEEKNNFIKKNKLVIWRFHDHWHITEPDGIIKGFENSMGWTGYLIKDTKYVYNIPKSNVGKLCNELKTKLGCSNLRVIGDLNLEVSRIGLSLGAYDSKYQTALFLDKNVDVLICGESREWETYEFAYDAIKLGVAKAVIVTGHSYSEEPGMEYCAEWFKQFVKDVPVYFIKRGSSFNNF
jgi:putative NIF3 family GTP cyclohydrolase 1 type 2